MKKIILICDHVHTRLIEGLENRGYQVLYQKNIENMELDQLIPSLYGIVINSKTKMDSDRIKRAKKLKFIARLGSGLEIIDLDVAVKNDIVVINSPEGNRQAVAEHALGMLLCLSNNLIKGNREVKQFIWKREENRGFELSDKTIGIIGFGNTGKNFAKLLSVFGSKILAYDKYKSNFSEKYPFVIEASFEEILSNCNILSFHLPLTTETKHFFDNNMMKKCRNGTIIINTSRGQVIDTKTLILGLESGKIMGACLDVFENEKTRRYTHNERLMYEELFQFDQLIVSPHVAGWTHQSLEKIATTILKKIDLNLPK